MVKFIDASYKITCAATLAVPRLSSTILLPLLAVSIAFGEEVREFREPNECLADFNSGTSSAELIRKSLQLHVASMFESMSEEAKRGYRHLTEDAYLPPDFDASVIERLCETELKRPWPTKSTNHLHSTWEAFGISSRPDNSSSPLQYVTTPNGDYVMNCFACHGGDTYGAIFPGAPNTTYALASLTESVRRIKLQEKIPLTHMDVGSVLVPLGSNIGTSNAVNFGVALMSLRDKDLNVLTRTPPSMLHHDMDAPAWWHYSKKSHLYADGFAEKGHRGLMQFMLVRENGPEKFRKWEEEFRDVEAFLKSVKPPKFPLPIDASLASRGNRLFDKHCASCHGVYGADARYPEVNVEIDEIGTDRLRWDSLTARHRQSYGDSWFAHYGAHATISQPKGYTAPPLDGIWASAPYLHNGSVPTLTHLLKIEERPRVWRRVSLEFDERHIGLEIESLDAVPLRLGSVESRWYFNTRARGKAASGHDYPDELTGDEKLAVLEYLKTL
jgi:mono/diheme cytochrome c family protein/tRNA threonylcarbamoyladenosine modification (KEOPS) complex  Pcc1 subunit